MIIYIFYYGYLLILLHFVMYLFEPPALNCGQVMQLKSGMIDSKTDRAVE